METITPEKLLLRVTPILSELEIDYYITGGFAVSVWGRPRATFDIDIVIKLVEPEVKSLAKALREISKYGYINEDAAQEAIKNRGEFNFIDPETGLKVDFWIERGDTRSKLEFERKVKKIIEGKEIYFISPEDLILNKLNWHKQDKSSRHIEDVESILKISGQKLNKEYLIYWVNKLGFQEILSKLQKQDSN